MSTNSRYSSLSVTEIQSEITRLEQLIDSADENAMWVDCAAVDLEDLHDELATRDLAAPDEDTLRYESNDDTNLVKDRNVVIPRKPMSRYWPREDEAPRPQRWVRDPF